MSFVSFQQEREREREGELFRSTILAHRRERGERECKVGTVTERGRAIRKEKRVQTQARGAVCLNPVGFPSVHFPVLVSEP